MKVRRLYFRGYITKSTNLSVLINAVTKNRQHIKTGAHKEVFAIALMIFSQKCYGVSIDNVMALMYNFTKINRNLTVKIFYDKEKHNDVQIQ